ncbi:MAG: hypothetical protein N4A49_10875 [Marinifilaceae bacterium]|jgi:hypothetical protein|nr:hypothetical protein [Marinifilaceae bacterium]
MQSLQKSKKGETNNNEIGINELLVSKYINQILKKADKKPEINKFILGNNNTEIDFNELKNSIMDKINLNPHLNKEKTILKLYCEEKAKKFVESWNGVDSDEAFFIIKNILIEFLIKKEGLKPEEQKILDKLNKNTHEQQGEYKIIFYIQLLIELRILNSVKEDLKLSQGIKLLFECEQNPKKFKFKNSKTYRPVNHNKTDYYTNIFSDFLSIKGTSNNLILKLIETKKNLVTAKENFEISIINILDNYLSNKNLDEQSKKYIIDELNHIKPILTDFLNYLNYSDYIQNENNLNSAITLMNDISKEIPNTNNSISKIFDRLKNYKSFYSSPIRDSFTNDINEMIDKTIDKLK